MWHAKGGDRAHFYLRPNAMLCSAVLCYVMLCYAMLCYAMLCYAVGPTIGAASPEMGGRCGTAQYTHVRRAQKDAGVSGVVARAVTMRCRGS